MERYNLNSWLNMEEYTKDAESGELKLSQIEAPLVPHVEKKRVITKVIARITVDEVESSKPFGKIEAMFKKAHSIKELEEIASTVNTKALMVTQKRGLFDYIKKIANGIMGVFIES